MEPSSKRRKIKKAASWGGTDTFLRVRSLFLSESKTYLLQWLSRTPQKNYLFGAGSIRSTRKAAPSVIQ